MEVENLQGTVIETSDDDDGGIDPVFYELINALDESGVKRIEPPKKERFIANGAEGSVYETKYNGEIYAIKVINVSKMRKLKKVYSTSKFIKSIVTYVKKQTILAKTLSRLKREYVDFPNGIMEVGVPFYNIFDDTVYIFQLMEMIQGDKLSTIMKSGSKYIIEESVLVDYIIDLMEVLTMFENESICHRDIKPDNVVYDVERGFVLIDFGGFCTYDRSKTVTSCKGVFATPNYASPEYLNYIKTGRSSNVDYTKLDVYSVGIIAQLLMVGMDIDKYNSLVQYNPTTNRSDLIEWNTTFTDLIPIVRGMVDPDPNTRSSASDVLFQLSNFNIVSPLKQKKHE